MNPEAIKEKIMSLEEALAKNNLPEEVQEAIMDEIETLEAALKEYEYEYEQ